MRFSKNTAETDKQQEQIVSQFQKILKCLLPDSYDDELQKTGKKLVRMAVDLKNVMTEERVLFKLLWVDGGEDFEEDSMEVEKGQTISELVLHCIFPGLVATKTVENDVSSKPFTLVKAKVLTSERV